jgi:hypothetical protein
MRVEVGSGDGSVRVGPPGLRNTGFLPDDSDGLIFLLGAILKNLGSECFCEAEDNEVQYNVQEIVEV